MNRKTREDDNPAISTHVLFDWIVAFSRVNGVAPPPEEITRVSAMKAGEVKDLIKALEKHDENH